jgi:hypothetical protein
MTIKDDRTTQQKSSHRWAVVMTDSVLSGWGSAASGASYAGWACDQTVNLERVRNWVANRGDALRVRVVLLDDYRPNNNYCDHFHIYVANRDNEQ